MNVDVSNLHFGYQQETLILNDLSFKVSEGEIIGILGGSGSGKSTLLRLVCGLLQNNKKQFKSGAITIDGQADTESFRRKGDIGMMFQEPALLPNLTLKENIRLPGNMNGEQRFDASFAEELITLVGLEKYSAYFPKQLSGGMQTRAALARTFVTQPRLLLLDEPFSSLDYAWKVDLYKRLVELVARFHSTTIIVSHDIQELMILADRVLILSYSGSFLTQQFRPDHKVQDFTPKALNDHLMANNAAIVAIQDIILRDKN